jgi:hypothetical protein
MIIHSNKHIFIHQPKTGGNTVANILQNTSSENSHTVLGMHFTIKGVISTFPEININEYTVVTVTRNPWERCASLYMQLYISYKSGGEPVVPYNEYFSYPNTCPDLFRWLEVDDGGTLPQKIKYLRFDNLDEDLMLLAKSLGHDADEIPNLNAKPNNEYTNMDRIIISDPIFQELISKSCKQEIEYFGYSIPTYDSLEVTNSFSY